MRLLATTDPDFAAAFTTLLDTARETTRAVAGAVTDILAEIRTGGDDALCRLTTRLDRTPMHPARLRIGGDEIAAAFAATPPPLAAALALAAARIRAFHQAAMPGDRSLTDATGLRAGLRWTALDSAGLYVPGGKAAYPSSVLMNAIPARVAGVRRLAMCVPAPDGLLDPLVLAAAHLAGIDEIYRIGGAQAVAALAFGTETIAPVDKIVGPGNAYVAEAKRQVFGHVGIDSVAGPSEIVILADQASAPDQVAMDLLAQAEHDEAAQAILITDSPLLADRVASALTDALATLPRAAIAAASLARHGAILLVQDWDQAVALVDRLAPEHLQLMLDQPEALFARIRHAGAVFLGRLTPEALGDYVAGPNHVLPTGRTARFASGLSVHDFLKRTSWIAADPASLRAIGPAAVALAEAEGLYAHARSISLRLHSNEA